MGSGQGQPRPMPTPHPPAAQHPPMGSLLEAVSRLLEPGVPGPSRIHRAVSMVTWLRAEPRISAVPWRQLTRPPPGKLGVAGCIT